jgi:hypothetical protein
MSRAISQALALAVVQLVVKSDVASQLLSGTRVEELGKSKDALIHALNIGFRFFAVFLALAVVLGLFLLRPQQKT